MGSVERGVDRSRRRGGARRASVRALQRCRVGARTPYPPGPAPAAAGGEQPLTRLARRPPPSALDSGCRHLPLPQ
eukprot:scaffold2254_cov393-Prasinococcus_capsulatus_cf.AAC.20